MNNTDLIKIIAHNINRLKKGFVAFDDAESWTFWDEAGNKIHEREYIEFELLDVWKNLREDRCSNELVDKYKQYIFT